MLSEGLVTVEAEGQHLPLYIQYIWRDRGVLTELHKPSFIPKPVSSLLQSRPKTSTPYVMQKAIKTKFMGTQNQRET